MYYNQRLEKTLCSLIILFFTFSKMPVSGTRLTGWVSEHKFLVPFSGCATGSHRFLEIRHHSVLQPTVYETVRQMQSTMSSLTERWQIIHLLTIHILCCLFLNKLLISLSQRKEFFIPVNTGKLSHRNETFICHTQPQNCLLLDYKTFVTMTRCTQGNGRCCTAEGARPPPQQPSSENK